MKTQTTNSKTGAASMVVVIFTTLLLGVIALGFVSIMISEANQTINYDLSQSAYDSSLAGIEDAKIALLKYHACLSGTALEVNCTAAIKAMTDANATTDCDIIPKILERPFTGQETIVQSETGTDVVSGGTEIMEQAYTCVKISPDNDDYLGTLTTNYRTKLIPIRTTEIDKVNRIRLSWYNTDDHKTVSSNISRYNTTLGTGTLDTNKKGYDTNVYTSGSSANKFGELVPAPSTMQFQLIQTDQNFTLAQLNTNSSSNSDRGTLLLRPSKSGIDVIKNSANTGLAASADKSANNPIDAKCKDPDLSSDAYQCSVDIIIPKPVNGTTRNEGTMFVRLILPYSEPETSFSVMLFDCGSESNNNSISYAEVGAKCEPMKFTGVQAKVDSTGRANDLFRRVEARVELVDIYYPFPEFSANIGGEDSSDISKNFWVTRNCWTSNPRNTCNNYGLANI